MRNGYAIHFNSYLANAGEFLSSFITTHSECDNLLIIDSLEESNQTFLNENNVTTVVIPYIHLHFRERLLALWEDITEDFDIRLAIYEFNSQYRMINDYLFDCGHKHGNLYKDFRDVRIFNNQPSINLAFTDVGRLLTFNEQEYKKLTDALNVQPLSSGDWIGGNWKNYVQQYRTQLEILSKK